MQSSTSSTGRSERAAGSAPAGRSRARYVLASAGCALALYGAVNAGLERAARHVELHERATMWWWEEWLQLFIPTNYEERGAGRLFLCGASGVREGVLIDRLEERLPGWEVSMEAFSLSTVETAVLHLEYIEAAYGADALPDAILFGVSPRTVHDDPPPDFVPFVPAIDRYCPSFRVDTSGERPVLEPKGTWDSLASRYRFLVHQQGRYETAAWVLLWRPLVGALFPSLRERGLRNLKLKVPKWHHLSPLDKSRYPEIARGQWLPWKPREAAERIRADFARLRALADRHGVRLFVVNLPEGSWTLKLHRRERFYADYFAVVQEALGEVPFVNLRRYLEDDEFYDWSHPTRAGAERLTDRLAVFLGKEGLAP